MKKLFILTIACFAIGGCSNQQTSIVPSYKLKIDQGNELDSQAVSLLQPGMSRAQVQMLLGTPLLQDPFHADRWDYLYVLTRNGAVKQHSSLTVYFEGDSVSKVSKNTKPVEQEGQEGTKE